MSFNQYQSTPGPCKGCPDRFPGCHDRCEKYQTWKAKIEAARKNRNHFRQIEDIQIESVKRGGRH